MVEFLPCSKHPSRFRVIPVILRLLVTSFSGSIIFHLFVFIGMYISTSKHLTNLAISIYYMQFGIQIGCIASRSFA